MQQVARVEASSKMGTEPRYWPISAYGVIGDCRTAALVGPDGSIDWCCLPHFDSPAILCRLLDADKGGFFRVGPVEAAQASMAYLPGTNILETVFTGSGGRLQLLDYMPIRQRDKERLAHTADENHLSAGYERDLSNDVAAAHRLQRMVTCLEGSVALEVELKASFNYARQEAQIECQPANGETAGALLWGGERYLALMISRLSTRKAQPEPLTLEQDGQTLRLQVTLKAGERLVAALNYARSEAEARHLLDQLSHQPFDRDLEETRVYWKEWSSRCTYHGPYRQAVLRSALALKLCIFEPTGAIVAAPTTSLPEWPGGVRNWDYRYTWLRDSAFTLAALGQLGYHQEAQRYFHFLHDLHVRRTDDLRIMYSIRGESDGHLDEQMLDHLEGYQGSRPVRIGNGAATQRQMDVYGEVLDAAYSYLRHEGFSNQHHSQPARDLWSFVSKVADYVVKHWQDRDRGIWEVRGDPQAFVYSRVMCWVALDRTCKIARYYGQSPHQDSWEDCRDAIREDILKQGYNEQLQSFTQAYGSTSFDAANLRLLLVRFLQPDDPRIVSTVEATARALAGKGILLYRYRAASAPEGTQTSLVESLQAPVAAGTSARAEGESAETRFPQAPVAAGTTDDGLPGEEGAFLACTFWLIGDLCYMDRVDEARALFEHLLGFAGPLGLFAEEVNPDTGEHLGNYPQAFTHIGLINCAVALQRAQERRLSTHPDTPTQQ